jgi:hypothetical protein
MKRHTQAEIDAFNRRVARVMEREMICSYHGAACYIEACRRERAAKRKARSRVKGKGANNGL